MKISEMPPLTKLQIVKIKTKVFFGKKFPTLRLVLDNEVAARDIIELHLDLNLKNKIITKYGSWDNHEQNIGRFSLKTNSGVADFRKTINGMINEIKRLEKENEILTSKLNAIGKEKDISDLMAKIDKLKSNGQLYKATDIILELSSMMGLIQENDNTM